MIHGTGRFTYIHLVDLYAIVSWICLSVMFYGFYPGKSYIAIFTTPFGRRCLVLVPSILSKSNGTCRYVDIIDGSCEPMGMFCFARVAYVVPNR